MRKILFIVLIAFVTNVGAQITLEHTYLNVSVLSQTRLDLLSFTTLGYKYSKWDRANQSLILYNLNHSQFKIINIPYQSSSNFNIYYISDVLFDDDSTDIDFLIDDVNSNNLRTVKIYNEDGSIIFSLDSGLVCSWIAGDINFLREPIVKTNQGTKMIVDMQNGTTQVYSLPGTISVSIAEANNVLVSQSSISNAYPNPTNNLTQIDYTLPDNVNEGKIVFYDLQGNEVKCFKVDKTFTSLLITTSDIAVGTYYYQLQTTGQNSEGKKLIVIK